MTTQATNDAHDLHAYLEQIEQPVLLLADCRGSNEGQIIDRWLQGNVRGTGVNPANQQLTVDLSEDIKTNGELLERKLSDLPDNTLIIPLRVLWLPAEGPRRLRDLFLGNPHKPGWLLQKLILHFTPDRCSPVYGEAATLG